MSHHHDHGHHHGHDEEHAEGHNHVHDHSDDITPALQNLLYEQVDFSKLNTLNEEDSNSGRAICQKTWVQRMEPEPELKSSADEQLLMIVPYGHRLEEMVIRANMSDADSQDKSVSIPSSSAHPRPTTPRVP
jgi:hypothetical protein